MRVIKTDKKPAGIPDYYHLYLQWMNIASSAEKFNVNHCLSEAYRYARLAEEFGLATIEDDSTIEDF